MKNYLLKEGYYFSYDYDLTLSREAYSEGYPTKLKYAWNLHMGKALLKLNDRAWFSGMMQGSIKYFKVYLEGLTFILFRQKDIIYTNHQKIVQKRWNSL